METAPLPPVFQEDLDREAFEALLRDLAALPSCSVTMKAAATTMVGEQSGVPLEQAREALERGTARAIQVRYAYEGKHWVDTIMRTASGFRVVRMEQPSALSP